MYITILLFFIFKLKIFNFFICYFFKFFNLYTIFNKTVISKIQKQFIIF